MGYFHIPNAPRPALSESGTGRIFLPVRCILAVRVAAQKNGRWHVCHRPMQVWVPATLALAATTAARHRRRRRNPCSWAACLGRLYAIRAAENRHKKTPLPTAMVERGHSSACYFSSSVFCSASSAAVSSASCSPSFAIASAISACLAAIHLTCSCVVILIPRPLGSSLRVTSA